MNTLDLIIFIAEHPEFTNIVLIDNDQTPMRTISLLAASYSLNTNEVWHINTTECKKTLLIY